MLRAITARLIAKFRPKVETMKTDTMITRRSLRPHTYRNPSRTCPLVRGAGSDGINSFLFIR